MERVSKTYLPSPYIDSTLPPKHCVVLKSSLSRIRFLVGSVSIN